MELEPALVEAINAYLLVRSEIEPADLAFIFGSRHGIERFCDEAARLWHERYFPHVLVSGGVTPGGERSEASILRTLLIERGVDKRAILVEERATNTGENVLFSMPLIEEEIGLANVRSLIAIGKFCTSRRYVMTLERHWPEVRKMLHPVHYHNVARDRWMDDEELCGRVLGEWGRIEPYFKNGFIAEVDMPGVEHRPGGIA
jgi:uncharacterized SAM-binding protein YcdF (DUF218 family)